MRNIKLVFVIIGIIGFILVNTGNKTTIAKGELDLLTLASVMQDENIIISEWSLHAREKMESYKNEQEVLDFIQEMRLLYSDWKWTLNPSQNGLEAVAEFKNGKVTERIKVLTTPIKGKVLAYLIYEAKGQEWGNQTEEISRKINGHISDIFQGNVTVFSCVKGEISGKIGKTLPDTISQFLAAFEAKEVETLQEESFISTSAYTPMLNETINTAGKEMNLQLSLRKQGMGAKTTVVVGTPIITIEY